MVRIVDDEDRTAGSAVRRVLDNHPALAERLADIPVVVFAPVVDTELVPDYFERVQAALTASVATHGRALYVASVQVGPLFLATKPFPRLASGDGVFVGYFAVGEGGALFIHPRGHGRGAEPALFEAAISAMMSGHR